VVLLGSLSNTTLLLIFSPFLLRIENVMVQKDKKQTFSDKSLRGTEEDFEGDFLYCKRMEVQSVQ
jgi:hypothetical protein